MSRGPSHPRFMACPVCTTIRTVIAGRECRGQRDRQPIQLQAISVWRQQETLETSVNVVLIWISMTYPINHAHVRSIDTARCWFENQRTEAAWHVYSSALHGP